MNPKDLKGAELDYWTALAEGYDAKLITMYSQSYCRIDIHGTGYAVYEPSVNTKLAADIAFKRLYTLYPHPCLNEMGVQKPIWLAEAQFNKRFHGMQTDESPHVAICRLCVEEELAEGRIAGLELKTD